MTQVRQNLRPWYIIVVEKRDFKMWGRRTIEQKKRTGLLDAAQKVLITLLYFYT